MNPSPPRLPLPCPPSAHQRFVRRGLVAWSLCGALAAGAAEAPVAPAAPLTPIATLDLQRYMGTWYEVAKFPNRFQGQCAGPASADYSLQPGGTVRVVNRCPLADGKVDQAIGEARRIGPEGSPTLEVRFAPAWLSWLPFVWGNYWVVDLDPAYQLAVVSEPKREFLWVLSRQPAVEPAVWDALMARLRLQGFDLSRLRRADAKP
ncbi:MAG: lipocalin family protein [Rubrivivax sp.]|nr:lipocalin family protein [Rubrivivax sp.]